MRISAEEFLTRRILQSAAGSHPRVPDTPGSPPVVRFRGLIVATFPVFEFRFRWGVSRACNPHFGRCTAWFALVEQYQPMASGRDDDSADISKADRSGARPGCLFRLVSQLGPKAPRPSIGPLGVVIVIDFPVSVLHRFVSLGGGLVVHVVVAAPRA